MNKSQKLGDCFEANVIAFIQIFSNDKDIKLCHGMVKNSKRNKFEHAWLEKGNMYIDFSNDRQIIRNKRLFYGRQIMEKSIKRYNFKEMNEMLDKYNHYGPWDGGKMEEKPKVKLIGENGNAFLILGKVIFAMKKAGFSKEKIQEYKDKATSGNYDTLLAVTNEYVEVV